MATKRDLSKDELQLEPNYYALVNRWLTRGDGVAVYENVALDSANLGHRQFVSYGSPSAQIETNGEDPPQRMPDIGGAINWRYQLVGVYRGPLL